mgnify:CR=1 FL=1
MRWKVSALVLVGVLVLGPGAHGEERQSTLRAGAGAQLWTLGEDTCRQDGDVFECTSPTLFGDFFLEARWRARPGLSVGLNLGYGVSGGTPEVVNSNGSGSRVETRLLRVGVEPRLHLDAGSVADLFLGLELGFLSVRETLVEFEGGRESEAGFASQPGPLVGASLGVNFVLWRGLELELGTRAAFVNLSVDRIPELAPTRPATEFGPQIWLGGYTLVGWRFGL